MKNTLLFFLSFISLINLIIGQTKNANNNILITSNTTKTQVNTTKNGGLEINVSPVDLIKFKNKGSVQYSDFGAVGDGKTDDIDAIAATHAFANIHNLMVKADDNLTYYISGKERTAIVKTATDFGSANFIIDDTNVENSGASIFIVSSSLKPFNPKGLFSLKKNQEKIDISLPSKSIITITNSNIKQYIRFGKNQNSGHSQTDIFITDKNGNVDMNAPIIWDFNEITEVMALPIEEELLTIKGGHFTTIANREKSKYSYYSRNLAIKRSNVIVEDLEHRITEEGDYGAPYAGFINISDCAYVTVKNTILTGHKTYEKIGNAGVPVSMGTYDIQVNRALNVSFINCTQTNDINDVSRWGIMASNYSKNLTYDNCILSRFDAHMGVANATIRNSTLGHAGINAIGFGTLTVENSKIYGKHLINLRQDYGSTWQGKFIIRNCTFIPAQETSIDLINGYYSGLHNFGYTCYMPEQIIIENLYIDDSKNNKESKGPAIFADFNPKRTNDSYLEEFPYVLTQKVILTNVTTASGKKIRASENPFIFKNVKIINN